MSQTSTPPKKPTRPAFQSPRTIAAQAPQVAWNDPSQHTPLMMLGGLMLLLLVAYWDMLALTSAAWSDPLYSFGWIVPVFSLVLLWLRWQPFGPVPTHERWIGVGLLAVGLSARLWAAYIGMHPLDRLSFLPSIFGVFIMVGGLNVVRWAWPALGFLVFMYPLPHKLEMLVLMRLQRFASMCSTFVLQTLGVTATREGNLITLPGTELNIAEACAGLRMATIFVALAVAMVFLIERPWWDKFVILLSAIPIALAVNVIRITVTGLLFMVVGTDNQFVQKLGHDWAGYFMMPLAMGFLWFVLQVLERLTVPVDAVQLRPVGGARGVSPLPSR